jgi:hypothetical protein
MLWCRCRLVLATCLVQTSARARLYSLIFCVFLSSPCRQMSVLYVDKATTASFQILSNSTCFYPLTIHSVYLNEVSIHGTGEVFLFSTVFRSVLGPTQPPTQGSSFPGSKAVGAWSWALVPRSSMVELYLHSATRFRELVFYLLSTGNLPFYMPLPLDTI